MFVCLHVCVHAGVGRDMVGLREVRPAPAFVTPAWLVDAVEQETATPLHRREHDLEGAQ
jgi:hypothetical protein